MKLKLFAVAICCLGFVSFTAGQDTEKLINELNNKLEQNQAGISEILSDPSLMHLHAQTSFREIIKQHARPETIKVITDQEPGTRITVKGIIVSGNGSPLANALVYVYQTSSEGWYSDTAPHILQNEGDRRHARLFGYFKTNAKGAFQFETVKPHGYPHSDLPAHIHFEIDSEKKSLITELLFDDDPRLVGEIRARALREQFIISKNSGTEKEPVYSYTLILKD